MATQVVDEARHLEVFLHRLRELGVVDPDAEIERRAQPALVDFKGALLDLVADGDWQAAVFAQNVILETMEYTVFRLHAADADAVTKDVLAGVISDERRHAGFGENDLGRSLAADPSGAGPPARDPRASSTRWCSACSKRRSPMSERRRRRSSQLANEYLQTVERLGLT